jgi:hypothetical protein
VCCVVIGAILGLRFKALVLVPASAISVLLMTVVAFGTWSATILSVAAMISLQLGYLVIHLVTLHLGAVHPAPQHDPRSAHG